MNDILYGLHLESFGYMYFGDSLVFQAKGFPANGASEVHVLAQFVVMGALSIEAKVLASGLLSFVVAMLFPLVKSERSMFEADAVLLFARTIIKGVQQVVFDEKCQGAENRAPIDGGKQPFEVGHGEGIVEILECLPDQDANSGGPYVVVLQVLGYFFVHRFFCFNILMTIQGA